MRKQFVETVSYVLKDNPRTVLLLGDVGTFAFRDAFKAFPGRVFNIGILEQAMVSVAAGWALRGYIPIVHTISTFLIERAFEQLKIDFGYQKLRGVFIGVGGSYDYSGMGCTHHCPADVSLVGNIPGFAIYVPGTAQEVHYAIQAAVDNECPTYIRLMERKNTMFHPLGNTSVFKHSLDPSVRVIAVGPTLDMALTACHNLPVDVQYVNHLPPSPSVAVLPVAKKYIIVEPYYASRLGSDISNALFPNPVAIHNFCVPRAFVTNYGHPSNLDAYLGFTANNLRDVIGKAL